MLTILTALDLEASPLIDLLGLYRNHKIFTHKVYENQEIRLIISGVGKVKAATAVARILSHPEDSRLIQKPHLVNIGFAASPSKVIGELNLINKITDQALGSNFYPEMYLKTELPESRVLTVDLPIADKTTADNLDLIDMEASAIFSSALTFLPIDHLHFLKIVSDNCSDKYLSKELATELFNKNLDLILNYLQNLKNHIQNQVQLLSFNQYLELKSLAADTYLSHTQFSEVQQAIESYLLKGGHIDEITRIMTKEAQHKTNRSRYIDQLIDFCESYNESTC